MRAQIFFKGGMLNHQVLGVSSVNGEWPTEIRAAYGRESDGTEAVEADAYVYDEVDEGGTIKFGCYTFVGNKTTARTLVLVWTPKETT
jgi:hypothetical protein